jgi:hypothetical protein
VAFVVKTSFVNLRDLRGKDLSFTPVEKGRDERSEKDAAVPS